MAETSIPALICFTAKTRSQMAEALVEHRSSVRPHELGRPDRTVPTGWIASRTVPIVERPAMSDYGVPADPEGALPWVWAQERLVANKNYWVVTASKAGRPHSMPVWGVWLPETERFWFSCSPNARKARNIAANPQVAVTVDDTVECVSLEGRARLVDPATAADSGDVDQMVAAYISKYWDDPAVHADMEAFLRGHAIIEVTPERAFGVIEREEEFSQRATRWRW